MTLSGDGSGIADARRLAADFLLRARTAQHVAVSDRAVELTRLVVSELVTNALKHAPGPAALELRITGGTVEVTVRDTARVLPAVGAVDPERVGGHGLEIVRALAEEFHVGLEPSGKRVTARIPLSDLSDSSGSDVSNGRPGGTRPRPTTPS